MVFKRRNPAPLGQRLKSALWPESGWGRAGRYIGHRLGRLPGTPYRIAAGFASGAAVSFTPFIGLHFVLAALLSLLLRGNVIASAIGTVVGNPWTFPLIWAWIFALGRWILGGELSDALPGDFTLTHMVENPWEVFWPMLVGSLPTALVAWVAVYFPMRSVVAGYQKARRRRLRRKVVKRLAKGGRPHPPAEQPAAGQSPSDHREPERREPGSRKDRPAAAAPRSAGARS